MTTVCCKLRHINTSRFRDILTPPGYGVFACWAMKFADRHVQYTRTDSGRQTLKVDPSTGSQVVTLLTEVNSATGSQVKDDGSYFSGGDGS